LQPDNLIFLGPPGAGKGTIAKALVQKLHVPHISTGDMLREAVASGSPIGNKAKSVMEAGELVSDDLMIQIVRERLQNPDCENGFVLDGYPRTVPQAVSLENLMNEWKQEIKRVFLFEVAEEILVQRITNRRVCPKCGRVYNLVSLPPKSEGVCDDDGEQLVQRKDDREDTVRERLRVYQEKTAPLVDFYSERKKIVTVDGAAGIDRVCEIMLNTLDGE